MPKHSKKEDYKDIIVHNPETHEMYNCSEIVFKLNAIYQNRPKKEFNYYMDILNSSVEWADTIEKQFEELNCILQNKKLGQEFKAQLDKIMLYANREETPYLSIAERFKEAYLSNSKQKGISLLCPELNRLTGGIRPGSICTIAGGPGSMKTTTAVNIAYEAVKQGKNVCYLTFEESTTQLFSKLLSRVSVDVGKKYTTKEICQHQLQDKDINILFDEVLTHLTNLPGEFHMIGEKELVSYEFTELERQLKIVDKNMKSRNNDNHGIDIIIVDHIQLLKYASNVKDEYKVMNDYVSFFRKQSLSFLGKDHEITVILISQVNREGISYAHKHNGNYLIQHVAEASEVERASSYIITTYTDATSQVTKLIKMGAIKLRGAQLPLDTVQVFADGEYYQVGDTPILEQTDYSIKEAITNSNTNLEEHSNNGGMSLDDMLKGYDY